MFLLLLPLLLLVSAASLLICCGFIRFATPGSWVMLPRSKKKALPPGTMGWPLLGETLEFLVSKPSLTSHPFFQKRTLRYGQVFKTHLFGQPLIVSTDAAVNQFVLDNEGVLFKSCQPIDKYREILGHHTLTDVHGELQRRLHVAVAETLDLERLKLDIFDSIQTLIQDRLATWQDQIVHVQNEATHIALGSILNCLIGHSDEDIDVEKLFGYWNDGKSLLAFPVNVFGSGYNKHFKSFRNLAKFLAEKIDSRCKINTLNHRDFLDAALEIFGDKAPASKSKFVLDSIMGILFHAEQTTAIAMTLLLKFISKSSDALNEIRKEHAAISRGAKISWEDYESMHFTKTVINETLRLANIVPWVFRIAERDVDINGMAIPKGWKVLVYLMDAHLNEMTYSHAKSFDPWRSQETSALKSMSLGYGPRCCPGVELTKMILALFLHFLVIRYSWEVIEDDELIRFPIPTFKEGFPIAVTSIHNADECLILH